MEKTGIMLVRMGSIPVWSISVQIISTHTTSTSLVVPIRAYNILNILAILSTASFLLDLNINPPRFIIHSATMLRQHSTMDSTSWNLTGEETLIPITHQQQNMDPVEIQIKTGQTDRQSDQDLEEKC